MTATEVQPSPVRSPQRSRRRAAVAVVLAVWLLSFAFISVVFVVRDEMAGDRFDIVRWQRATIWGKWLFHLGEPLRNDPAAAEAVERYFNLANRRSAEGIALENVVERAIEARVGEVLGEMGIRGRIPFPGPVFPPVNIELATPPRVLVESPRDEIRRANVTLLRPDLDSDDVLRIEHAIEREHQDRTALVLGVGGVATYPAIINAQASYQHIIATTAHEWAHHYLAFHPLGIRYFTSPAMETINETVADVIGLEVADIVIERWGDPTVSEPPPALDPEADPVEVEPFNYREVLRELRVEVDLLLYRGEVSEAERRMEETRRDLQQEGIFFRRVNQSFFAWHGSYAARPDSVDPSGPLILEVRERSEDLPEFIRLVRDVTSRADLRALVEDLRARDGEPEPVVY